MAKVGGPLLSLRASGSVGKKLTFSQRKSGQQVRSFHRPRKSISLDQWTQRHIMGLLTAHWQVMTDNEKAVYNDYVSEHNFNMSGFNRFVKLAQTNLLLYHGLVGYWSCNQRTGAVLVDNSGNGNDGDLKPAPMSNSPQYGESFQKEYGNCLTLDGVDDYVLDGDLGIPENGTATIEGWFKFSEFAQSKGSAVGLFTNLRQHEANNFLYLPHNDYCPAGADLKLNNWYHIVLTYSGDGSTAKIYIDSVFCPIIIQVPADTMAALSSFNIGRTVSFCFGGQLDEIKVYNRELSEEEIIKHYQLLRFNKNRQNPGKLI